MRLEKLDMTLSAWGFSQMSRIWQFWGRNINLPLLDCCFLSRRLGIELLIISNEWCRALSNTWPGSCLERLEAAQLLFYCCTSPQRAAIATCPKAYVWLASASEHSSCLGSVNVAALILAYEGFDLCTCSFEQIMLIGSCWVVLRPVMHKLPGSLFTSSSSQQCRSSVETVPSFV